MRGFQRTAPPTALSGTWNVELRVPEDSAGAATGTARVDSLTGSVAGVLLDSGTIPIRLAPDRMSVETARVAFTGGYLTVNGGLGRGGRDADMDLVVRSDTLGYLEPLLRWVRRETGDSSSVGLDGAGRIEARLSGTTEAWTLDAELSADGVTAAGGASRAVRGRGRLAGGSRGYAVAAQLSAEQVTVAGLSYEPLELNFNGPLDSLTVRATAGFAPGSSAHVQVTVRGDSAERLVRVEAMDVRLPMRTWTLASAGTVRLAGDGISFDTLELRESSGAGFVRVQGTLPLHGGIADFVLAADSLPVADVYAASQRDAAGISGVLNGTLHIAGPVEMPTMEARIALSDGGFTDYRLPLFQILARYTDQRLTLKGGLWQGETQLVTINGSLPLDLALRPGTHRELPGEISIVALADSLDLEVLAPPTDFITNPAGRLSLDVRIGGTWSASRLSGFVDLVDGAMTIPALGARYTRIDARLELADSTVRVARGQLHGGNGVLDLSGSAVFAELAHPKFDVTMRMARFAAFDLPEFGSLTGTGTLHLGGRFPVDTLTGSLTVDAGYLQFADLVQKRIVSLNDPEFRALVDANLARSSGLAPGVQTTFLDSLRVDSLFVRLGNDVWLRSSEANIQLAGDFVVDKKIEGGLPRYRLDGTMRAVRGTYRLAMGYENSPIALNKEFRVTRGTVRFFGTPDFNPEMDIVAENTVRPVEGTPLTVRVLIGGTLLYPRLTIESDAQPPLSQTEIVSVLVFGRLPSTGTGSESSLLASVLGSAIGGVGEALVSELGLPLSYLTIVPGAVNTSTGMATTRIEAGVQVGDRTFLTLNAGLCEIQANQIPGAGLEYRFSQRWTLAAAFDPVVQDCGTAAYLAGVTARYQFGLDLNWQMGIR
jgi:translocation and assembly module TamB